MARGVTVALLVGMFLLIKNWDAIKRREPSEPATVSPEFYDRLQEIIKDGRQQYLNSHQYEQSVQVDTVPPKQLKTLLDEPAGGAVGYQDAIPKPDSTTGSEIGGGTATGDRRLRNFLDDN